MESNATVACPRCDRPMTERTNDKKGHLSVAGICLECGYTFSTKTSQTALADVNVMRIEADLHPFNALRSTKE